MFNWRDCYARYINLSHRKDRLAHMINELDRVQLSAERFEAIRTANHQWDAEKYGVMLRRTPGAVGCFESQLAVMKEALAADKSAFVMEDDLVFCSDIKERLDYIETFLNKQESWDVLWLGGTVHINPPWWHTGTNRDLPGSNLGRDAETTEDPRMLRTYGAFSTHAYIVNKDSIEKVNSMLDSIMHEAMGIDWAFIKLAPQLKCFMFLPGCVKQYDAVSDIGFGITKFSGFAMLGPYWWADKMEEFDPATFDFKEAKI